MIFLHEVVDGTLAVVGFDEGGIKLEAFLGVLQPVVPLHELDVSGASIRVDGLAIRISAESLCVNLDCPRVVALLVKLIAFFAEFLSLDRVYHFLLLVLPLELFGLLELVLHRHIAVLQERALVKIDGLIILLLSEVSSGLPGKSLPKLDVVIVSLGRLLDCLVALFDALVILLHLIEASRSVRVVSELGLIYSNGLPVEFESLLEVLGLVSLIALGLLGLSQLLIR